VILHPCQEVYGIHRLLRNWGWVTAAFADAAFCIQGKWIRSRDRIAGFKQGRRTVRQGSATMRSNREAVLTEARTSFWGRHRWLKWAILGVLAVMAVLAGIAGYFLHRAEPFVRARIVKGLEDHFHARVELDSFKMSLVDGLRAEGGGLRIWPPAPPEGATSATATNPDQPLISLSQFRFHAALRYSPGKPIHISTVELSGLEVHVPPKSHLVRGSTAPANAAPAKNGPAYTSLAPTFEVDTVICSGTHLVMETDKPGKVPLEFEIHQLTLRNVSKGGAMDFVADLTNPRPTGIIHTTGSFGPWVVADPGESPVEGQYEFDHADLSDFKGISGILSSTGKYQGTLRELIVDGETDTPEFKLPEFGNALHLRTNFHAKVDGTNGDTWLDPVSATLGQSHFTAQGQVVRVAPGEADHAPEPLAPAAILI